MTIAIHHASYICILIFIYTIHKGKKKRIDIFFKFIPPAIRGFLNLPNKEEKTYEAVDATALEQVLARREAIEPEDVEEEWGRS